MKKFSRLVLVVTAVAVAAPAAHAQRGQRGQGFGRMSSLFLLGQKSVQEDLKLSEDQVSKVTQLADKQREAMSGLRDLSREERQTKVQEMNKANEKAVAEVLKPEQHKRLKQITLQQRGAQALSEAEVADALGLSSEQKDKLKTIREDSQKEMRALFQGGNREEARKKFEELRKSAGEKAMDVLTAEQKAKWKEMLGEPFKGEIARPAPRGGNRPRAGTNPPPRG